MLPNSLTTISFNGSVCTLSRRYDQIVGNSGLIMKLYRNCDASRNEIIVAKFHTTHCPYY